MEVAKLFDLGIYSREAALEDGGASYFHRKGLCTIFYTLSLPGCNLFKGRGSKLFPQERFGKRSELRPLPEELASIFPQRKTETVSDSGGSTHKVDGDNSNRTLR
uniref:Uncharacterized protein n=1 Tax=Timema monikensis TaxID=170555 RepID=A0A7R9EJ62_9NEOP|nr:unnamed protein product [Timema monikensis]